MVRCLHTADWHVGKVLKGVARLPEHGWRVVSAHVSLLAGHDPGRTQKG